MAISLGELAERFDCELIGDPAVQVERLGSLVDAGPDALSFLSSDAFKQQLPSTKAAAVILKAENAADCPVAAIVSDDPYASYARMAAVVCPPPAYEPGVHATAFVAATAKVAESAHVAANAVVEEHAEIGDNVYIGPGAVIGPRCRISRDSRVLANATLVRDVEVGERCILHPASVTGSDGFGNAMTPDGWIKVPQVGGVRIGNDVEIGAGTTIDCGTVGDTEIGNGVRLDNQVHIAHNVKIGDHTAMAACVGISGSVKIGKRCMFAGMSGAAGHLEICDDVVVLGKGVITKSIRKPGAYAGLFPAEEARKWNRRVASLRRLDKLQSRVSELEKKDS
ncbi:MAG: UDP-3-O-(3-hydroxymyristoyl)glucosamine N-acyltransferase [Woeseiaceae bacterium]|nr:UDP-3-O-(3-hydroxymyristoyl)glucosamine N-acyltransferase [Woeseiaceae bacterium]